MQLAADRAAIQKGRVVTAASTASKAKGTALWEQAKAQASARPATTAKPATMQATRPATTPAIIGNGIFKQSVAPTLTRAEWQTLSAQDKSRFFAEGGKLVDPPEAAKPHRVNGQLTRAGFDALTPAEKGAHCKSGAGIVA
jgi:hypothetical protein